ncbi:52 kDa repressor of the inhibitor of the protein kinase-like [Aphis craccivora]|uniref:52 kDa repressor of the inhibitor of the protein kinase-like n=1 Tax=Aphis craccivora TaxID=307492 RepID=A0A6G0YT10_APHCR|nr:52 kDa repressor of the inhibitor of the protein kinase-like [Aphis craccivora]
MAILDSCDSTFYPNINHLLRVLATLPASTTEVERSFSTLKIVKTLLRNQIENDRLTGLTLYPFIGKYQFHQNEVLNIMAKSKRKLLL